MVYECGEGGSARGWKVYTHISEVTAVCDLLDNQYGCGCLRADPGSYGAATEHGRFVAIGDPYSGGLEDIGWDWNGPGGGGLVANCNSSRDLLTGMSYPCYWRFQPGYILPTYRFVGRVSVSSRP